MDNQQQPECLEDYKQIWIGKKWLFGPPETVEYIESLRTRLAEAKARVNELESGIPAILESQKRTEQDILNFTPVYNELIRQRNENLDRAIKAEARAGADAAKLARVKALLDGAGPVLNELSLMQSFVNELDEDDDYCDWISAKEHRDGAAGEHLPALLSVISEVREVLKGE